MDARGTLLLSNFITSYDAKIQSLILHLLFTKSLQRGNIYKLCLLTIEEHSYNINTLTIQYSKAEMYHAGIYKLLLHCADSLISNNIYSIYEC